MISVRLHFHGAIDRRGLPKDHELRCPPGTTVEQMLLQLGYPAIQLRAIVAMKSGQRMSMGQELCEGDSIDLLAPAGGG